MPEQCDRPIRRRRACSTRRRTHNLNLVNVPPGIAKKSGVGNPVVFPPESIDQRKPTAAAGDWECLQVPVAVIVRSKVEITKDLFTPCRGVEE